MMVRIIVRTLPSLASCGLPGKPQIIPRALALETLAKKLPPYLTLINEE